MSDTTTEAAEAAMERVLSGGDKNTAYSTPFARRLARGVSAYLAALAGSRIAELESESAGWKAAADQWESVAADARSVAEKAEGNLAAALARESEMCDRLAQYDTTQPFREGDVWRCNPFIVAICVSATNAEHPDTRSSVVRLQIAQLRPNVFGPFSADTREVRDWLDEGWERIYVAPEIHEIPF